MNGLVQPIAVAAINLLLVTNGNAASFTQITSGADFITACTRADESWISFCNGYVQAVFDAMSGPSNPAVCAPEGLTRATLVGEVVQFAEDTNGASDDNAFYLVFKALSSIYPCT